MVNEVKDINSSEMSCGTGALNLAVQVLGRPYKYWGVSSLKATE